MGMKKINVSINGLGRIGRAFLRAAVKHSEIEVMAVNDLMPRENAEYLLRHDSVYGGRNFQFSISPLSGDLQKGDNFHYFSESDPNKLPWKELDIDVVVE